MSGGAAWKVAPAMDVAHELIDTLIFDGMLELQAHRLAM
jgi:type III pantothenate kinase